MVTTNQDKTLATLIHLSVFSQFIIPFGNFILPVLLWSAKRKDDFIDRNGRNALNFQISLFLYALTILALGFFAVLITIAALGLEEKIILSDELSLNEFAQVLPLIIIGGITATLISALFILEIFAVISASLKAGDGKLYEYPLSINFLKKEKSTTEVEDSSNHQ